MNRPHYFLFSNAQDHDELPGGRWQFVLQSLQGREVLEASEAERDVEGERLELLAVVRGLEALNQPSRVTLVTTSRRVARGLRHGLSVWRANGWQWERFGRLEPIKNGDLWRRVDRALQFHEVDCRSVRIDTAHEHSADGSLVPPPALLKRRRSARRMAEVQGAYPVDSAAGRSATAMADGNSLWGERRRLDEPRAAAANSWSGRIRAFWEEVADRLSFRPPRSLAS